MAITDFDDVFETIGGFGRYQWILFAVVCIFNCFLVFISFGQIFMTLTPPHWCSLPLHSSLDHYDMAIPTMDSASNYTLHNAADKDSCSMADVRFIKILDEGQPWRNGTSSCPYGWDYNYTTYYPTISSQLNWVCEEDWKPAFTQSVFFCGSLLGNPIFGWLADNFGRMPVVVATNLIIVVFGTASSLSSSFLSFCIFRFIVGLTFPSFFTIMFILAMEYVSAPFRTLVANVPILVFLTSAVCGLPWIAKWIHDWSMFGVAIHAPLIVCLALPWVASESARWLISRGQSEKSLDILQHIGRVNGRTVTDRFTQDFKVYANKQKEIDATTKASLIDLIKTPVLRTYFVLLIIMWCTIIVSYDAHVRNTERIGYDFFITFTVTGAVEFPAGLITILLTERLGRNFTTVVTLGLSGVVSMSVIFLDKDDTTFILAVAILGRFLITMAINVGQQYMVEVLPTAVRAQGTTAIFTMGAGLSFVTPYIVYSSKLGHWVPLFIIGTISISGAAFSTFLPETRGKKLPDSLEDGMETFGGPKFCYSLWTKSNSQVKKEYREETMTEELPKV